MRCRPTASSVSWALGYGEEREINFLANLTRTFVLNKSVLELAIRPGAMPVTPPLVALRDLCPDCGDPRFDFAGDAAGSHSPLVKVCTSCRKERAI